MIRTKMIPIIVYCFKCFIEISSWVVYVAEKLLCVLVKNHTEIKRSESDKVKENKKIRGFAA